MENQIYNKKSKFLENLIIITAFSAYFAPAIVFPSGFWLRLDDIFVLGIFPILFLYSPKFYKNVIISGLFLSILSIIMSTLHGYAFLGIAQSTRDITEIVRLSKPLIFSIIMFQADNNYILKKTETLMPFFSIILIIFAFIQYFNFYNLGEMIAKHYTFEHHIKYLVARSKRVVLTGSNANNGAAIAMLFFLYNLFYYACKNKLIYLLIAALLLVSILMTSSRTAFISLIIISILFFLFSKSTKFIYKFILISICFGLIAFLYKHFQYLYVGLELALQGENTSLLKRFVLWENAFESFKQSPIWGLGPGKAEMSSVVDGEFFLLLRRYGLIGTIIITFTIFIMPFIKNIQQNKMTPSFSVVYNTLKYYSIVVLCVMITNNFFSSYQLLLPFIYFSILVRSNSNELSKSDNCVL